MAKRVELHLPKQSENILVVGEALVVDGLFVEECGADNRYRLKLAQPQTAILKLRGTLLRWNERR